MSNSDWMDKDFKVQEERKPSPVEQIMSKNGAAVELPPDIAEVWGGDPNAVLFVREWGVDAFRSSKLHQMAVLEKERQERLTPVRQNYVKKQQKK